jgi:hypothetical protein
LLFLKNCTLTHSNIRNSSALAVWNFSVKFCLTNFAIDCCTFSLLILLRICRSISRFVSFWNHFDSVRFYLKIRLTKILHYEVFKVQRTFVLPANAVSLPVLRSVFVVTEHLISYHRIIQLSTTFWVFIKSFFPVFRAGFHHCIL